MYDKIHYKKKKKKKWGFFISSVQNATIGTGKYSKGHLCNVDISYCCFLLSRENIHQFLNYSICFILSWVYNGFDKSAISVIIIKKKKTELSRYAFESTNIHLVNWLHAYKTALRILEPTAYLESKVELQAN